VACFLTLGSAEKDRLMTLATIISRLCTIAPTGKTLKSQSPTKIGTLDREPHIPTS
jgi:hypothetical protein